LKKYWGCKYNPYNPGSYAPGFSYVECVNVMMFYVARIRLVFESRFGLDYGHESSPFLLDLNWDFWYSGPLSSAFLHQ